MSSPENEDAVSHEQQPVGIVERLVRDDVDRKRFLKMAGSAGAASFGAFVLAACGSSIEQELDHLGDGARQRRAVRARR